MQQEHGESREPRDGFDVLTVEYETCFVALVDHLYPTGFILDCMMELMEFLEMERPLVCLFHDRILIFTKEKRSKSAPFRDLELTASLKLETIFRPGAAAGCRLTKTRIDDYCDFTEKTYLTLIKLTEIYQQTITNGDSITLDTGTLLCIECQQGYQVFFNNEKRRNKQY